MEIAIGSIFSRYECCVVGMGVSRRGYKETRQMVGSFQGMGRQLNKMARHPFEIAPAATGNGSGSQLA